MAGTYRGLEVMEEYWARKYANLTPARLARELIRIAKLVQLSRYRTGSILPNEGQSSHEARDQIVARSRRARIRVGIS